MNKKNMFYRYTKISVSDKKMSNFLYAIFMTDSKLESYNHLNLERFTRKQNSGNMVSVAILIDENKITPTTSDKYIRPAKRPSYSVLSNEKWVKSGLKPLPSWKNSWQNAAASVLIKD